MLIFHLTASNSYVMMRFSDVFNKGYSHVTMMLRKPRPMCSRFMTCSFNAHFPLCIDPLLQYIEKKLLIFTTETALATIIPLLYTPLPRTYT